MSAWDDVSALRAALHTLERTAAAVCRQHAGSVDAQRLTLDIERVGQDISLLCGPDHPPVSPRLQVIEDTAYPQDFWMDAEDEGLGGGH